MQLPRVPGETFMSLLRMPTRMQQHTHKHTCSHACPPRSLYSNTKLQEKTSQGNQADRSKSEHTGIKPFRMFENLRKGCFPKIQLPPGLWKRSDRCCSQFISGVHTSQSSRRLHTVPFWSASAKERKTFSLFRRKLHDKLPHTTRVRLYTHF